MGIIIKTTNNFIIGVIFYSSLITGVLISAFLIFVYLLADKVNFIYNQF